MLHPSEQMKPKSKDDNIASVDERGVPKHLQIRIRTKYHYLISVWKKKLLKLERARKKYAYNSCSIFTTVAFTKTQTQKKDFILKSKIKTDEKYIHVH